MAHLGLNDAEIGYLNRLIKTIDEESGRILISKDDDGSWMVGMEWGYEAPDSPMVGAVAYGLQDSLESSLSQAADEAGK